MSASSRRRIDAAYRAAEAVNITDVARERGLALQKIGAELIGPCPRCGGRDRFAINIGAGPVPN